MKWLLPRQKQNLCVWSIAKFYMNYGKAGRNVAKGEKEAPDGAQNGSGWKKI